MNEEYENKTVDLTEEEFNELNSLYPPTKKEPGLIGKRAVAIVKSYFCKKNPGCEFNDNPGSGLDLEIKSDSDSEKIEIKGTDDSEIAWNQIRVSSKQSYDQLKNDIPLYRVTRVYNAAPIIYILKYSKDFEMIPEPRWSVKPRGREKVPVV